MRETAGVRMESFHYGGSALWSVQEHVAGSTARRLEELVSLFFRSSDQRLLLDLRAAGVIDSAGAAALTRCQDAHPAFGLVGLPPTWGDLPLEVRVALRALAPAPDLVSALADRMNIARAGREAEQRHHTRISTQVPVELYLGGRTALVSLRDISRGGVRLDLVPADWIPELQQGGATSDFEIFGLAADPLGREVIGRGARQAVSAHPVHIFPGIGLGARFLESHPPV